MRPAPNSSRKTSQRSSHATRTGGAVLALPVKMARKPLSHSSDSQPKPYHVWPTLTMDR
jgi:hypothetical protein